MANAKIEDAMPTLPKFGTNKGGTRAVFSPNKHLIINCTLELESNFNSDSNSDNNDDKNNGFSSALYSNKNYDDSNSDSNPKAFIILLDLIKEQELKWFSDNNEDIMSKCTHNTDVGFDLRYPG
ncbi:hypothetical protein G9A89_017838 [Geosiphon pyriformis]|nr:hypothetical protein G9A89_017838 [Geosiphon pyriformis]